MAADDDKIKGPQISRRLFLGGAAAAPLLVSPAAAAAGQALAPVSAAAARQALVAIPGVMGVIARKHLNLDLVLNEAMRFMGTNDDEFLAYHFNELLNPNPISVEPGDNSIKGIVGRLRHIVWHTQFDEENDYCFNGASYDLHSPINVVFSSETKFAYFMAKKSLMSRLTVGKTRHYLPTQTVNGRNRKNYSKNSDSPANRAFRLTNFLRRLVKDTSARLLPTCNVYINKTLKR